jgi:hypothetical protein
MKVVPHQVYKRKDSDFCVIRLDGLPPGKDLSKYFAGANHALSTPGFYVRRELDGSNTVLKLDKVFRTRVADPENRNKVVDAWCGHADTETASGNCGMPLILETPIGPAIGGTHYGGSRVNNYCVASLLCKEFYDQAVTELRERCVHLCVKQGCELVAALIPKLPSVPEEGMIVLSSETASYNLTSLHPKAPVRWIEDKGELDVFGSLDGFRSSHTSDVERTPMFDFFSRHDFVSSKCAPDLKSWKPKRLALLDSVVALCCLDQYILDSCVYSFANDVLEAIDDSELRRMEPLSWEVAINGCPGVAYIDPINKSTSCGFPWRLPKTHLLIRQEASESERETGYEFMWSMRDELRLRVEWMQEQYVNGLCAHPVFCAQLKDEPVSEEKAKVGKTRVFVAAPVDFTLLVRKVLLPFVRLVQNNKFLFEAGPGTAAQSREWEEIYQYLTQHGTERLVAGDYSAFDKKMAAQVVRAALNFILLICIASGNFSDDDLKVLAGICVDVNFPVCDFFGDLIRFLGTNPSGWPLTVILNGIVNSIYMRYAYYSLNPLREVRSFKRNVALMTYGDDNSAGISASVPWFNHTSISTLLATIGVKYTMADKKAESVPYIPISEVAFLKRKWRWESEVGCHVCPIEVETIKKQLTVWVKSKVLSPKAHCVNCLYSAHWELFFHGRDFFDKWDAIFKECVRELALEEWMPEGGFPTWESYVSKWQRDSTMFVSSLVKFGLIGVTGVGASLCGAFSQTLLKESKQILRVSLMTAVVSPLLEELVRYWVGKRWGWKASAMAVGGTEFFAFVLRKMFDSSFFPGFTLQGLILARLVPLVGHIGLSYFGRNAPCEAACVHVAWNTACMLPQILSSVMGIFFQDDIYRGLCLLHKQGIDSQNWPKDFDCGAPWCASWHAVLCHEPKRQAFSSYLSQAVLEMVSSLRERVKSYSQGQSPETFFKVALAGVYEQSPTFNYEYNLEGKELLAEQLLQFDELTTPIDVGSQKTKETSIESGISLGEWFKRPILIKRFNLSENSALRDTVFPWDLYFNNAVVKQKIRGYSRLRARLHIKFVLNVNPYRYGALMASYLPLGGTTPETVPDEMLDPTSYQFWKTNPHRFSGGEIDVNNTNASSSRDEFGYMARSQRPNIYMDLNSNQGGEMILPFLYHSDWIDASNAMSARPTTFETNQWYNDIRNMGQIYLESVVHMQTIAAASTDKSVVSLYAWCEEIELGGASFQKQGGDDYQNRPVSSIASAVAAATGALGNVPIIGPYMRASSMIAGTLGSLARWFGFSNPPVVDSVRGYKTMTMANLCSPEISTQIEKLTLDPKQEVNIDPRTVGAEVIDDLAISNFAGRLSYIFAATWYTYDEPLTTIASWYVTPELYYATTQTTGATGAVTTTQWQLTPAAHVSQWFEYWRGGMTYHIKIVKTKYHTGRLMVTYDPAGSYANYVEGLVHSKIVDLSEVNEFDFEVPYMAVTPWLRTTQAPYISTASQFFNTRGDPGPTYDPAYMNGIVKVQVLNDLGSMDKANPVTVLIYAKASSDFELSNPICFNRGSNTDLCYSVPYNLEGPLISSEEVSDKVVSSTVGEACKSIRQLMHRACYYTDYVLCGNLAGAGFYYIRHQIPKHIQFAGPDVLTTLDSSVKESKSALHKQTNGKGYNYVAMTPIPYFACCFVGMRGSVVHRLLARQCGARSSLKYNEIVVGRGYVASPGDNVTGTATSSGATGAQAPAALVALVDTSASGMVVQSRVNGSTDVVAPHYSQYYMVPANPSMICGAKNQATSSAKFEMDTDGLDVVVIPDDSGEPKRVAISDFVSAGVDLQFFQFLNVPSLYTITAPTGLA